MAPKSPTPASRVLRDPVLTYREKSIAICLTQGLTDAEIAVVMRTPIEALVPEIELCMAKISLTHEQRPHVRPLRISPG
jgi:hypothetical protein